MTLRNCVGFLLVAVNCFSLAAMADESPELVEILQHEGTPKAISASQRGDLKALLVYADVYGNKLNLGCSVGDLYDVRLKREGVEMIAGYKVTLDCDDAPTSSLALFFDINSRFIGAFDPGR